MTFESWEPLSSYSCGPLDVSGWLSLAASLPLVRVMTSELFGVSAFDPTTYLAVSALVLGAAALASYIPARRTIAVDATEALRCE